MNQRIVITIDGGVDYKHTVDGVPSMHEAYLPKLKTMKQGDSFFLPGLMAGELNGLIRFAQEQSIFINAHHLDHDPIYRQPGVRAWRVDETEFLAPSASDQVYYMHINTGFTYKVRADIPPSKDPQVVRITQEEYMRRPDYTGQYFLWADEHGNTWWQNLETGEVFEKPKNQLLEGGPYNRLDKATYTSKMFGRGKLTGQDGSYTPTPYDPTVSAGGLPQRATEAELSKLNKAADAKTGNSFSDHKGNQVDPDYINHGENGTFYWYHAESDAYIAVHGKPPVDAQSSWTLDLIAPETYREAVIEQSLSTYWRKADGSVVKVPAEKYDKARNTKGAVEVDESEYQKYIDESEL